MSRLRVVFDLDDTLYPERDFAIAGFHAAADWAERRFGVSGLATEMTDMLDAGLLGKIFPTVLGRHAPDHTAEDLKAFHAAYRACEPRLTLFPDAHHALELFGSRGPIGLITDGTLAMQQKKVSALGIAHRFRHIVFTDSLGGDRAYFKPHPRAFEEMAAAIGDTGDRFVYVGDNPAKDFVAPNALGWTTIQVVRERPGIHDHTKIVPGGTPQHRISSLDALHTLLHV